MRHLPRPRSRYFRTVSVLAALAWLMLGSGALAGPLQTSSAMAIPPQSSSQVSAQPCDGVPMAHADTQRGQAPAMPMGNGRCCHAGCHCVSACNAVITVPRLVVAETFSRALLPVSTPADPAPVSSAPPLRPPIA